MKATVALISAAMISYERAEEKRRFRWLTFVRYRKGGEKKRNQLRLGFHYSDRRLQA
jgi:hypothetical protein